MDMHCNRVPDTGGRYLYDEKPINIPAVLLVLLCLGWAAVAAQPETNDKPASTLKNAKAAPADPVAVRRNLPPETAFALTAAEAEKGNTGAMLNLGGLYERGVGVARNYLKAFEWYEKAARAGLPEGWYNLGVCHEIGMGSTGGMAKALECYQKAAELGLPLAMFKLSSIYFAGTGTPKNVSKGLELLHKAVDKGLAVAANELGIIYLSGLLGQKKDGPKALDMFNRAANLGSLEAMKNLAVMYKDGMGVAVSAPDAYKWYLIARRGGFAGEDISRMLSLLEGSLSFAAITQARKDADAWIENLAKLSSGA